MRAVSQQLGGQHHHPGINGDFAAGLLVDIGDATRQAIRTDHHFASHGAGAHFQIAGLDGGKDMHTRRVEVGVDAAGAAALRAVMAGGAPVDGPREDRQARRDAWNTHLVASQLHDPLVAARRGRRQKLPVGGVLEAFRRAENADQFFRFVVVGRQVVVRDRPIEAAAVPAVRLEVVGTHAQGDAAVMIGAATQHARAPPHPLGTGGIGVGFARHVPAAEQSRVEIAEGFSLVPAARCGAL